MASRPWRLILFICARYLWAFKFNKLSSKRGFADLYKLFVLPLILFSWGFFVSFIYISCCNFFFSIYYLYSMQSGPLMSLFPNCRLLLSYFKLLSSIVFFLQARLENNVSEEMQKLYLRWLDIVFILCARARLLDFWGIVILVIICRNNLGFVRWWTARIEQVPDACLYGWCKLFPRELN